MLSPRAATSFLAYELSRLGGSSLVRHQKGRRYRLPTKDARAGSPLLQTLLAARRRGLVRLAWQDKRVVHLTLLPRGYAWAEAWSVGDHHTMGKIVMEWREEHRGVGAAANA